MTVPLVVILALLFGNPSGDSHPGATKTTAQPSALPPLTPSAPPSDAAAVAPCTKLLQSLPERLGNLLPRVVHPEPDSLFVVAWGDPAVVLRCGVGRPADLKPGSSVLFPGFGKPDGSDTVYFDITSSGKNEIYTTVDRAAYIEVTMPSTYSGSQYMPILAEAIAKALPPVCVGGQPGAGPLPDQNKLCVYRK